MTDLETELGQAEPIDAIRGWLGENPAFDPLETDLLDDAVVAELRWPDSSAAQLIPALRAFQRIYRVEPDVEGALALLRLGYDSAQRIAATPRGSFVRGALETLDGDEARAERLHRRASRIRGKVRHLVATLHSTVASPHARALRTNVAAFTLPDAFEPLPSYQELFGTLDYYRCDECDSILGPAAYLVDLLRIVDEYVSQPNAKTIPDGLAFERRRPDIGGIPLTCEETTGLVPYLVLANERLERATAELGVATGDVFQTLATLPYPFALPYNLPLAQIRTLLGAIGLDLATVFAAWGAGAASVAREQLRLSPAQYSILTTSAAGDQTALASYYGVDPSRLAALAAVDLFLAQTRLDVEQLGELLNQNLSAAERDPKVALQKNFFVNGGLAAGGQYLEVTQANGAETIQNLDDDALDRVNRFVRLASRLDWTFEELDWALHVLAPNGKPAIADDPALIGGLADLHMLAGRLELDLLDACSLVGPLKTYGEGDGPTQFDQVFNAPAKRSGEARYHPAGDPLNPSYAGTVTPWTIGGTDQAAQVTAAWLGGSLQLPVATLDRLGKSLFGAPKDGVPLTVDALSALHRHALLMRALGLSADAYFVALTMTGNLGATTFDTKQVRAVADAAAWIAQSPLDPYSTAYVVNAATSPYVDLPYDPAAVHSWLQSLAGLLANVPSSTRKDQLYAQLAILFGSTTEVIEAAMPLAATGVKLPAGVADWEHLFIDAASPNPYEGTIGGLLDWASRWLMAAGALGLSPQLLASVQAEPQAYGFPSKLGVLSFANLQDLARFQSFVTAFQDTRGGLVGFVAAVASGATPQAQAAALAPVTGWDATQVQTLLEQTWKGMTNAVTAIARLKACFDLATRLGTDVSFPASLAGLATVAESQWSTYTSLAETTRQKVAGLYDTATWESTATRLDGHVEATKRDALLPLVTWKLGEKYDDITSSRAVYEYLLIDVDMGPVVQTSKIVEATNAAQLYLQRCRLRLEQGIDVLEIPEAWWTWLTDYREWQANREVFLYPENYLLPSVRHTKTDLFRTLESQLQQSEVTDDSVTDAYTSYFQGFRELAKLKPVDCYVATVADPVQGPQDTLFLFARSETSPARFYYCTLTGGVTWSEWQQVGVTINSEHVTPVFAFNRLFVFWSELKQQTTSSIVTPGGGSGPQSTSSQVWKLSANYSFLDHDGKWVPPQSLVSDAVVNFVPPSGSSTGSNPNPFPAAFDMTDLSWAKVYAFKSASPNLFYPEAQPGDAERISVAFGPILDRVWQTTLQPFAPLSDPDQNAFAQAVYDTTVQLNSLAQAGLQSYLPVNGVANVNVDLRGDYLLTRNEFLSLSAAGGNASANPTFVPQIDTINAQVQVLPSGVPIYDNYIADGGDLYQRPTPQQPLTASALQRPDIDATLAGQILSALTSAGLLDQHSRVVTTFNSRTDIATPLASLNLTAAQLAEVRAAMLATMGTLTLFSGISPVNGRVITAKNQPGAFVFDNGDESFLISLPSVPPGANAPESTFDNIDEALAVRRPRVGAGSFAVAGVTTDQSAAAFSALQGAKLVDGDGDPDYAAIMAQGDLTGVLPGTLSAEQVTVITDILHNAAFASPLSFQGDSIGLSTAQDIVEHLSQYQVIDDAGRLNPQLAVSRMVEMALAQLVTKGELTDAQITSVYETLVALGAPVELAYANTSSQWYGDLRDYAFEVTRTSTGAADRLSQTLFAEGIDGLLTLAQQQIPVAPVLTFARFDPNPVNLIWPDALDGAQVDFDGVYGLYYWEVFFHVPMLVANALMGNQQFQDAQRWFRYVLDPTAPETFVQPGTFASASAGLVSENDSASFFTALQTTVKVGDPLAPVLDAQGRVNPAFAATTDLAAVTTDPLEQVVVRNVLLNFQTVTPAAHYWQFAPFRHATLDTLEQTLSDSNPAISVYESDPFDPHAIAALRIGAYEKATLMQYVENLIQWGDQLFSQYTMESVAAATMLYVHAYDLLGDRPADLGPAPGRSVMTFDKIKAEYAGKSGGIPTFLIELEHMLPRTGPAVAIDAAGTAFNDLDSYFCVPENEQLLGYWDTLDDRLHKIRSSMNIEGQVEMLPLFAPPISPLDLVKAAAASSGFLPAQDQGDGVLPPYRFATMVERAKGVTAQVADLGSKLLASLEKQDAEDLALLRNTQEAQILALTTTVKQNEIEDLTDTLAGLQQSLQAAQNRVSHYQSLIAAGLSAAEQTNLDATAAAATFNIIGGVLRTAAAIGYAVPQVGSPFAMTYGGEQIGAALTAASGAAEIGADVSNFVAQTALQMAGYGRRAEDWTLALQEAQYEVAGLEQQIAAAQVRLASARQELAIHEREIAQNAQLQAYLTGKFTSSDLYQWMVARVAAVYFQAYRLALDLALRAQQAYRFELARDEAFVSFGYWDNLRKGLMTGENLAFSLAQMESAYLANNTRRLEIERTVSLGVWDPNALWHLKTKGACTFHLTEELFDYDYPGHYNRQIKSVAISIPAVIGPYENVKATLTQTYSAVVTAADKSVVAYLLKPTSSKPSTHLRENWAPNQKVAISRGVDDTGLFLLDFRDERYLPFEGTGAVSKWHLSMPQQTNRFDFDAIGDVIVTVRYTAVDGGTPFAQDVQTLLKQNPLPGAAYLRLAQAYATQWAAFMADHSEADSQTLTFQLAPGALAYMKQATLTDVYLKVDAAAGVTIPDGSTFLALTIGSQPAQSPPTTSAIAHVGGLSLSESQFTGDWTITVDLATVRASQQLAALLDSNHQYLDPAKLLNLELIVKYTGEVF